jgi:2-dehydropantoate 2-reductase
MVGSVVELAGLVEVRTPHIDAIYDVASLLARTLSQSQGRLKIQPTS